MNPQSSVSFPPFFATYVSIADLAKSGAPGTPRILTYQLEPKTFASVTFAETPNNVVPKTVGLTSASPV